MGMKTLNLRKKSQQTHNDCQHSHLGHSRDWRAGAWGTGLPGHELDNVCVWVELRSYWSAMAFSLGTLEFSHPEYMTVSYTACGGCSIIQCCVEMSTVSSQLDWEFPEDHVVSFWGNSTVLCTVPGIQIASKNTSNK